MCALREKAHLQKNYTPRGNIETIKKGTYYLVEVDDMFRRKYEIKA
jgi:hydroxymethylglutaryl-CoA synthase